MAITNLTNLTSAETFADLVNYSNDVTGGFMSIGFVVTLFFIITMISLKKYDIDESLLIASFFGFVISIGLTAIELLNAWFIVSFGVILALTGFWVYFNKA